MLTLLTTTGCRPEAWAICEKLMLRQDYDGDVRWVVVDDGEIQQPITFKRDKWLLEVVKPSHVWKIGANTQQKNLIAGLRHISESENLVIIEDDDYYAPNYLTTVSGLLNNSNLIGQSGSKYYNVKTKKHRQLSNVFHSSLCSTAMKGDAIAFFKTVCQSKKELIDVELWRRYKGKKQLYRADCVIGIKGLPGRDGIGIGHKSSFQGKIDADGSIFRQWLKSDSEIYEQY